MWWNYKTKQYDSREIDTLEIAQEAVEQDGMTQALVRSYVQSGLDPLQAVANILSSMAGHPMPFPVSKSHS